MSLHALKRVLLLAVAALAWALPLQAQTGSIRGRVTDQDSGQPLAGAQVQAINVGNTVAGEAMTEADGQFIIQGLPPGTYALSVDMVGYEASRRAAVRVLAGQTSITSVQLRVAAFVLNPVVVSASKKMEKSLDAPASVSVVDERAIDSQPAVTPADYLRSVPGVDIITQGVQSTNVSIRGFNNIFSGSVHMLTDYRIAGVPSLRVNVMQFIPTTSEDIQRMEVVLGPGSALYGPNTADGVLHILTKSPLTSPGTEFSVEGGSQTLFKGSLRTAQKLSDRVGLKVSGQYVTADEWPYTDSVEVNERIKFTTGPNAATFQQNLAQALGSQAEAQKRIALIGTRDNTIERWSVEGRLDWRALEDMTAVFQSGVSAIGNGIELTGLGAAEVQDWRYAYYQARMNWGRLFAQGYVNTSEAGSTYLLRTGQPIVDHSRLWVGQVQHGLALLEGKQSFTYGLDYLYTDPRTEGTINGKYENEDQTTEVGGYVQSESHLTPKWDLVLAGRLDSHSALPDPIFSPRAAVVFHPTADQAFRLTYNRAFSTPTSLNQFLDLPTAIPDPGAAALGYSVRVQGTGETGFHFRQSGGGYLMRSPFTPGAQGGPSQLLPADATLMWQAALGVVAAKSAAAGSPIDPQLLGYLQSLSPTAAEIQTDVLGDGALASKAIPDVNPIRESTTTTVEAGYKGILADKLLLAVDGYWSRRQNLTTPLTTMTPLLSLDAQQTIAYLVPRLQAIGMSAAQASAVAQAIGGGMGQIPVGVISSAEVDATGAQLLASYTNVDESIDLYGVDLAATALLSDAWSLGATASFVNKDHFETHTIGVITLNAPKEKGSVTLTYRPPHGQFNGELRTRFNSRFPAQSGVYNGTRCIGEGLGATDPCVDSYTLVDLTLGWSPPTVSGASLQVTAQNLFDAAYRSFPGVPNVGRMVIVRLKYGI